MTRLKTLNQLLTDNPNLLSFVVVPTTAQEDLDAATLKTAIIRRCGDVEPYYQKPADFSLFGTLWFSTHDFLFTHALEIWNATYNPIENYNRIEVETVSGTRETSGSNTDRHSGRDTTQISETKDIRETHSGTDTTLTSIERDIEEAHTGTDTTTTSNTRDIEEAHTGTDTTTRSGSKSGSDSHSGTDTLTDNVTRETEIAGFNSSNYSDANKESETGTHATAHGESIAHTEQTSGSEALAHGHTITTDEDTTGSEALAHGHTITTDEDTTNSESLTHGHLISTDADNSNMETVDYGRTLTTALEGTEESETTRESHIHGNIGVTTSQQMLESEMNLASKFWIYDYIASAFETDNFITTYNSYYDNI